MLRQLWRLAETHLLLEVGANAALSTQVDFLRAKHILIVEEDPDWRWLLDQALRKKGYECTSVAKYVQAFALLEERRVFAAVIATVEAEGIGGMAFAQQAQGLAAPRRLPVVLFTLNERFVSRDRFENRLLRLLPKDGRFEGNTSITRG